MSAKRQTTLRDLARATGSSDNEITHLLRVGAISATSAGRGRGHHGVYSDEDAVMAAVAVRLRRIGLDGRSTADAVRALRQRQNYAGVVTLGRGGVLIVVDLGEIAGSVLASLRDNTSD